MRKTVLLTGATGFVGRHVISNLLDKNIKVRAIVRKGKKSFFKDKNFKIELIETDDYLKRVLTGGQSNAEELTQLSMWRGMQNLENT